MELLFALQKSTEERHGMGEFLVKETATGFQLDLKVVEAE